MNRLNSSINNLTDHVTNQILVHITETCRAKIQNKDEGTGYQADKQKVVIILISNKDNKLQAESGVRIACKEVGRNLWADGNFLYIDCGGGYLTEYICQNS